MNWSLPLTDGIVSMLFVFSKVIIFGVALYGIVSVIAWHQSHFSGLGRRLLRTGAWMTAAVAMLGIVVTYSIFRNQALQNAENSLNEQGTNFVNWERSAPEVKCLYEWHAFDDASRCLDLISASPDTYRNVMLYIEEALFLLETAESDRKNWGSGYADDVKYWAEDISADPTGMFAYNIVSENDDPLAMVESTRLSMSPSQLCDGYERVVRHLSSKEGANLAAERGRDPMKVCTDKLEAADLPGG